MRLYRLYVIDDNSQDFTVVSVYSLNDLFQIGICCGIVFDNQHNSVRLLNQRKRVNYNTYGRSVKNNIIKVLFKERSSEGLGGIAPYVIAERLLILVLRITSSFEHSPLR